MNQLLNSQLPGGPTAPREARQLLETAGIDTPELSLLVSEVVTNSVRHGGCDESAEVEMRVAADGDRIAVAICDTGPGFEQRPPAPNSEEGGGYGLFLVEQLAERWGVERNGQTCVWFELSREAAALAA